MQSSQEVEFKVGDKAVYPAQGVAEVISIDEKDIAGQRQRFYVLRILDTDRKIMVPVSNANAVGLRQVISEQDGGPPDLCPGRIPGRPVQQGSRVRVEDVRAHRLST